MYRTLFDLAGFAIVGWLPLIFAPGWKVTRRIAESAIFPVYLCTIYLVGVVAVLAEYGPGIMADFGNAEGVLGLLSQEPGAMVAWIHILAFDQVVATLIYRDNMKRRILPLPVQSALLVLTLMFGPIGFLTYWLVGVLRGKRGLVAWGERESEQAAPAVASAPHEAVRFADVVRERTLVPALLGLWRRERALVALGGAAFTLAAINAVVAMVNGSWLLGAEGELHEAAKFDTAVGIYNLSLALLIPLAGFTARGRRRWIGWAIGLTAYSFYMENVQTWRGLDPRFSTVAGPVDQALGGVFFLSALGIMTLFIILALRFFQRAALPDHPALRLSLRYAGSAALLAFGVGIVISVLGGRYVNGTGSLMPIHAAGFHGLQALPLVALLLGWSSITTESALKWIHIAGTGWLLFCVGLILQPLAGLPPTAPGLPLFVALAGFATWIAVLLFAWRARRVMQPVAAT